MARSGICRRPARISPSSRMCVSVFSAKSWIASPIRCCCSRAVRVSSSMVSRLALGQHAVRAGDRSAANGHGVAVRELLEERGADRVHQAHAGAREDQRARVRVAGARRGGDVDDRLHAGLDEVLGGHAVEVRVVDDRDVLGGEPAHEVLGALPQARGAMDLRDQARERREACRGRQAGCRSRCGQGLAATSPGVPQEMPAPRRRPDSTRLAAGFRRAAGPPRRPRRRPACGTAPRRAPRGPAARPRCGPPPGPPRRAACRA